MVSLVHLLNNEIINSTNPSQLLIQKTIVYSEKGEESQYIL